MVIRCCAEAVFKMHNLNFSMVAPDYFYALLTRQMAGSFEGLFLGSLLLNSNVD